MNMAEITYSAVAAKAESLEQRGLEPSVRSVRDELGGGSNTTIAPLLRTWKAARAARDESSIEIDSAILDLLRAQLAKAMAHASNQAELRAKEAEDAFDELAKQMTVIEAQLSVGNASLAATQAKLLQHQGQLQANEREMDELKALTAATVAEADQRAERERAQAEAVRRELSRATIRLEQVPDLHAALEEGRQQLKACQDDVARAKRSEAVATSRAHAQQQRANESAARVSRLEQQLQRMQDEQGRSLAVERTSQAETLRLSTLLSAMEARCAVQVAEIGRLRDAQKNASESQDTEPPSTPAEYDQLRAA